MHNSSDPFFDDYADLEFADAVPVSEVPALARLQAEQGTQSQVTMQVDTRVLAAFKARAEMMGSSYQTLINEALRQFVEGQTHRGWRARNDSARASSRRSLKMR